MGSLHIFWLFMGGKCNYPKKIRVHRNSKKLNVRIGNSINISSIKISYSITTGKPFSTFNLIFRFYTLVYSLQC
jgi:hypothetical protein